MKRKVKLAGNATLSDGTVIQYDTDALQEGSIVMTVAADGTQTPLASGEYTLQDGTTFTVEDGIVVSVGSSTANAASGLTDEQLGALTEMLAEILHEERRAILSTVQTALSQIPAARGINLLADFDEEDEEEEEEENPAKPDKVVQLNKGEFKLLSATELSKLTPPQRAAYEIQKRKKVA